MPAAISCDRCGTPFVPGDGDMTPNTTISMRANGTLPGGMFARYSCPKCQGINAQIIAAAFPYASDAAGVLSADQLAAAKAAVATTTQAPA